MSLSQKAEIELVKKAQKDLNGFAVIYDHYFEKVYKFFHFRIKNAADSEDLTSETFEKVVKNLPKFEDQGHSISAWIFRIAHNVLVDYFRSKDRRELDSIDELTPADEPCVEFNSTFIDNKKALEQVKEVLSSLPEQQRDIWALKLGSDMSNKDIASTLNMKQNHVNVIMFRTIKVIKSKLKRYQF